MHTLEPLPYRYSTSWNSETKGFFDEKTNSACRNRRENYWNYYIREAFLVENLICDSISAKKKIIFFSLFLENLARFSFLTKTTIFLLSYYYFMVPRLNLLTICSSDQISRCFFSWAQPANISAVSKELYPRNAN